MPIQAYYKPSENGLGTIVINENTKDLSAVLLIEEVYHAYQDLVQSNDSYAVNVEMEAKAFASAVVLTGGFLSTSLLPKAQHFNILNLPHGEAADYIFEHKSSYSILYYLSGREFVSIHHDEVHYNVPVYGVPERLEKLMDRYIWKK